MSSDFPFLDRIPTSKRLTALNDLQKYQTRRHHSVLDVTHEFRAGRYDPTRTIKEYVIINLSEDTEEDMLNEIQRELSTPPHSPEKVK